MAFVFLKRSDFLFFHHHLFTKASRMRWAQFLSLASLVTFSATVAAEESDVISLTPSNFASVVNKEDLILVEFFAPW